MTDSTAFFAAIRTSIFHPLSDGQVAGCNAVLDEAARRNLGAPETAYVLATVFWETGHAMQPVREEGLGHGKPYGRPDRVTGQTYYGRGLCQITWKSNYAKFAKLLGADLVGNPDLALQLPIAVKILFGGMIGGLFTGKKLSNYFGPDIKNFVGARRIINGSDHASDIANIAQHFLAALTA